MTTPIKPMSAEEIEKDSLRFGAVTHFGLNREWLRSALASHLAYVKEKIKNDGSRNDHYSSEASYSLAFNDIDGILQSEIDELTK